MNENKIKTAAPRSVPISKIAPEVLRQGGSISFIATGNSMWPHIRNGDGIRAVPLRNRTTLKIGWVIVYLIPEGQLVVHRIVGKAEGDLYGVRGDASTGNLELVPRQAVLGRVVTRERHGRTVDLASTTRELEGRLIAHSGAVRVYLERFLRVMLKPLSRKRG